MKGRVARGVGTGRRADRTPSAAWDGPLSLNEDGRWINIPGVVGV